MEPRPAGEANAKKPARRAPWGKPELNLFHYPPFCQFRQISPHLL